jgi:hypothetical protein
MFFLGPVCCASLITPVKKKGHMFIRKKKNRGGTTTVQLLIGERRPGKKYSNLRLIKSFGTSSTQEELDELIQKQALNRKWRSEVEKLIRLANSNTDL